MSQRNDGEICMVKGLEHFKRHFSPYIDQYVLKGKYYETQQR